MIDATSLLAPDAWLGGVLARQAFRLQVPAALDEAALKAALAPARQAGAFVYAKVAVGSVSAARALQAGGFYLVDTNVLLDKAIQNPPPAVPGSACVRASVAADRAEVSALAGRSFVHTRFHQDPCFDRSIADAIKAGWADNFYTGRRGDDMVVAERDGRIAGFLQLLNAGADDWVIDLIAVDERCRGQGVARDMIRFAEGRTTRSRYVVGTQVANTPSLRLYESLGFRVCGAHYVFHAHLDKEADA